MPETIGEQLKQARQKRRITLEKASEATHIRLHFLQALEVDDYSAMSSAAQARGFLRNYCTYLEIDLEELLVEVRQAHASTSDELHGPLQQVEVAPPSPEPVRSDGNTQPIASPAIPPESPPDAWLEWLRKIPARLRGQSAQFETEPPPEGPGDQPASPISLEEKTTPLAAKRSPSLSDSHDFGPEATLEVTIEAVPGPSLVDRLKSIVSSRKSRLVEEQAPEEPQIQVEESSLDESIPDQPQFEPVASSLNETAEKILQEIGRELRTRRELISLTQEEVDRHIHVRAVFIDALEKGDASQLPSAVQTRGMLANYSDFLDLDTDALLLRFADSLQASHRARHPVKPGTMRQPPAVKSSLPPLRSFVAGDLIFGLGVVVMVVALIAWGLGRVFEEQAAPVILPTAPSISDVLAGTSAPPLAQEVTLIPVADTPFSSVVEATTIPEATPQFSPVDPEVPVMLTIVATERTFMRVLVDGEEIFNGRVMPGVVYTYEATSTVQVLAGNAAALRVTYNGRDLGLLGTFGEVVEFIYTANEIVTPLPAASATPTASPFLSPTASTTATFTPTVTRTPTLPPP